MTLYFEVRGREYHPIRWERDEPTRRLTKRLMRHYLAQMQNLYPAPNFDAWEVGVKENK